MEEDGLIFVIDSDEEENLQYLDLSSGTAIEVMSVTSGIDLSDYMPFEGKSR